MTKCRSFAALASKGLITDSFTNQHELCSCLFSVIPPSPLNLFILAISRLSGVSKHFSTSANMSKLIAIVAGVGSGTGAAVARKFSASYPVVLMARNPDSYNDLVKEINGKGGKAIGISTDVADAKSVKNAVEQIEKEFGSGVGAAVSCLRNSNGKVG